MSWNKPGIGQPIFFMFLQAFYYFALVFFVESGFARRIWQRAMVGSVQQGLEDRDEEIRMGEVRNYSGAV